MNKKIRPLHRFPTRDSLQIKRHTQTTRKGMEKDIDLMDLEDIALNEISQMKTNVTRFHIHVESKEQNKQHTTDTETILRATKWDGVWGDGKEGQRD